MKKVFMLIVFLTITGIAYCIDVSGSISANTTWDNTIEPYIVTGNITIDNGFTLTIDPSVVVKFNSGRSMQVNGTLNANSATFTSNQVIPAPNDWQYIQVGNASYSGSVNLTNCVLQYANKFYVYNGSATLTNTIIEFFYYYGAEVLDVFNMTGGLIDMTGYYSPYGYGIYARDGSVCTLNNMSIINSKYGITLLTSAQVDLTDCTLTSNVWPVYFSGPGTLTINGTCDFTGNERDAIWIHNTSISQNWTMPYVNVPYWFNGNFDVTYNYTLTIESQNILKFPNNYGLDIHGKLIANAAIGDTIYFTSAQDDNWGGDTNNDGATTAPAHSNWEGIKFFENSDPTSVMRRCYIRYAGSGYVGGISLDAASPTIEHCELQQNYFGAYFENASNPTFNYNTVGSSQKTPIAMSFEANPSFIDNVLSFMDNEYDAIGLLGGTLTANANIIQRDFTTVNNITYVMLAQITVPSAYTLTIADSVVIKSSSNSYRIIIEGKLVCDGEDGEDRIVFTSVADDNFGNPGDTNRDGAQSAPSINDMGAIIFEEGHDPTSILNYVLIKYASVYSYDYVNGGSDHNLNACAVAVLSSLVTPAGPTISNCEFRDLHYGISCYQRSNPVITNNTMINIDNTPFSVAAAATPTFSGNTFTNVGINALGLLGHNVVNDGTISPRTVAGYSNITYMLLEDITIMFGAELTITEGVVFKIDSKIWYIDGGFAVNGTSDDHVVFTSLMDDNVGNPLDTNGDGNGSSPAAGDWEHIEFRETSDDGFNVINYADISYGGYSNPQGMVRWTNAAAPMYNTVIDRSHTFGLWFNGDSNPVIDNVIIQNCTRDPIAMSLTANPTFTNITFAANASNGIFLIEGLPGYSLSSIATLNKRSMAGFPNIAYIIDELLINSNGFLTLEAGIIIKVLRLSNFEGIYNYGGLKAIGLPGERIIFTSFKDDDAGGDTNGDGSASSPADDDWDGIMYYETGDDDFNILEYCEIRYTGGGYTGPWGPLSSRGAARVKDAKVTITETNFQQGDGAAIGIYGSADPVITNCDILNFTEEPIFMAMFSNPTFSGNTVANVARVAIGIQNETYSQTATVPQRDFATYTNITYISYGATINSGTTITIPAGTVFKADYRQDLIVNGELAINGTNGSPVVFTDYRDDAYGNPADTEQNGTATAPVSYGPEIIFNDVSDDDSYINYAIMRYTQYPIQLNSASPHITFNTFYQCIHGITNSGVCIPQVDNNTFDDLSEAPIRISLVAFPSSTVGNLITGTTYKMIKVNDNETLTSDQTLQKRSFGGVTNIPYLFDDYTIGTGVTLTIDAGVICKFLSSGSMSVNHGLIAIGTPVSGGYIVFTSLTDDFYGGDSNSDGITTSYGSTTWDGITINGVAYDPNTLFTNCIFRWAKYGGYGIKTISAKPTILNCSFNNCYYGIIAEAASQPTINYCDFYNLENMAVNNVGGSLLIDATNCWWGSNTGPTHSGNPGGTGEPVSDDVDYNPYGTDLAINPLLGDVSLNSIIQAYDATLVLLYAADPVIYPLTPTQQNVGDVTGNGSVMAFDAAHILEFVVGIRSYFQAALLSPAPIFVSDVALNVGDATVEPGEEFDIPLVISNVSNLQAMQIIIHYDPELLIALEFENLLAGMNTANIIDEEAGLIKIAFAGIESLESDITIANLKFKASDSMGPGIETELEAEYFVANETDLTWNVHNGTVMINGLAVGFDDQLTNPNNQMECYPNPFTDQLTIKYTVHQDGDNVFIGVYNLFGQLVAEIVNGKHATESYKLTWDGNNSEGSNLKNGIYFIRFKSGETSTTKKIQIVR